MTLSPFKKSLLGAALSTASLSSIATTLTPLDLDTSFDGDGMLTANYSVGGTYHTYFRDVEITPNDKILAVGHTGNTSSTYRLLLVKYNLDGSLDTSFGTGGKVNLAVESNTRGEALAIQPDGKLIIAGHSRASSSDPWSVFVKRLNVDGSIDPSFTAYNFTSTATVNTTASGNGVRVKGIALTANGKILVSMTEHHATSGNIQSKLDRARLVQLSLDGSVDTAFGTNGLATRSHHAISYETGKLALSPAGDIFLPGKRLDAPVNFRSETMTMIKYDSTGNLDHFDGNLTGWKRRAAQSLQGSIPKAIEQLNSALVLPDGNVISVGCIADYGNSANHNTARIQRQDADGYGLVAVNSPIGKQHSDPSLNVNNAHPGVRNEHCFNDVTYHPNPNVGIIAVGGIRNGSSSAITTPTWPSLATSRYTFTPAAGGNASTLIAQQHTRRGAVNQGRFNAVAVTHGGKIVSVGYMLNGAAHEAVVHVTQGAPLPATAATDSIGTLSFTDATDVAVSTAQSAFADNNISTTSTTGFTAQVYGGTAEVNNLAVSNPLSLVDGDSITLEHVSASTDSTKTTTAIVVNNGTGFHRNNQTWAVGDTFAKFNSTTTAQPDATPDAFVISPRINTQINSVSTSSTTITGITVATPISISSGGEYSINGAGFTSTAGTVENNDTVTVRHTNSGLPATAVTSTLTIGGVSADFSSTTENADTYPNTFTLQPSGQATPAPLNEVQTSQTVTISGINTAAPVTVTDGEYSINGGAYTSAPGSVNPTDTITVRHTSSGTGSTTVTSTLDVGGQSATFTSTTDVADTTPDAFTIQPGSSLPQERLKKVYTTTVIVAGINAPTPISIAGGEYQINGSGGYVATPGTVDNGDRIIARHTTSDLFDTQVTTTLTIGGVSGSFSSTTVEDNTDTTPDAFDIQPSLVPPQPGQIVYSTVITVSGITGAAPISITNGIYQINNGGYVLSNGTVNNGDTVRVRHTASNSFATTVTSTLTIGGVSSSLSSTTVTADNTPDPFSFSAANNVALNSTATSSAMTVRGISTAVPITVTNGEYSINGGAWNFIGGTVTQGSVVRVRHTTAGLPSSQTTTRLTIGSESADFVSTTSAQQAQDTVPDAFSFSPINDVTQSTQQVSAAITVAGIDSASAISIVDGEYRVNGGTFTDANGFVNNGDTVEVRHTSANGSAASTTSSLTIGGVSADFVSTTEGLDLTPDNFSFEAQNDLDLDAVATSDTITVAGFNAAAAIEVTGGEYQINGGAFTSDAGNVNNGDTVTVRHTTASSHSSEVVTTLSIDTVSADFVSTTKAAAPAQKPKKSKGGGSTSAFSLFAFLGLLGFRRFQRKKSAK
ncbi:Uncharacterised protein [BD1-7 clade bacterium]|uniref:Uncharacterized protein n=1 Tax=BD1-7 clade bacterium TaxID=2029982 RepID=A0A5S9PHX9_9GAMM|nr:Uncharacterised protein [BD1-7 clade bacterium]